jgi:hypothetical protein
LDNFTVSPQTDNELHKSPPTTLHAAENSKSAAAGVSEASFELGLWLLGLKSYLKTRNHPFLEGNKAKASTKNWSSEARLMRSALLQCTRLALRLNAPELKEEPETDETPEAPEPSPDTDSFETQPEHKLDRESLAQLAAFLRNAVIVNENLLNSPEITFQGWLAFSNIFAEGLERLKIAQELINDTESSAAANLPPELTECLQTKNIPTSVESDLRIVFPYFGRLLKYLSVVEEMLRHDKPLKPALLIFAAIYEQLQEMMRFINNRLLRFRDENTPLFEALDCVVYATSVEIRKIYSHELAEISETRQALLIYAKMEAAHSLLRDCVQQSLIGLAQTVEPEMRAIQIFPNFKIKLDESLILRQKIWELKKNVQSVENSPESTDLKALRKELNEFVATTMRYLMFKDWETFERFVEEIVRTRNNSDLTPVLHRFGAYLETLFGQVNIRAVLADHPFQNAEVSELPQQEVAW